MAGSLVRRFAVLLAATLLAIHGIFAVSTALAATPNVGSHIHVEIANHPADGFPIPRANYTFNVKVTLHDFAGKLDWFRVSDGSTVKQKINLVLGPCADCSTTFPFTVNFGSWSQGRHELRWSANDNDADPATGGSQRQYNTSRSQVCLGSCSPNVSGRATPFQGGGSWYQGHDYATNYLLSPEASVRPGGSVVIRAAQDATNICAFVGPHFHDLDSGVKLGCWTGQSNRTVTIPADTAVGTAFVVIAHDGFNAGVFRMLVGDGSPRPVLLYEYQSWWAKTGLVFP